MVYVPALPSLTLAPLALFIFPRSATSPSHDESSLYKLQAELSGLTAVEHTTAAYGRAGILALEVFGFFYLGEVIGRGNLIGYPVGPDGWLEKH